MLTKIRRWLYWLLFGPACWGPCPECDGDGYVLTYYTQPRLPNEKPRDLSGVPPELIFKNGYSPFETCPKCRGTGTC